MRKNCVNIIFILKSWDSKRLKRVDFMNYSKSQSFKKVLSIFFCAILVFFMFLITGCEKESVLQKEEYEIEFPLDDKEYPKNNLVMFNNKSYPLDLVGESNTDSEIEIKMDQDSDLLEIIFPQYFPINYWSLDEKEYLNLISYSRFDFSIKDEIMVVGQSRALQKFVLSLLRGETSEILLKWSNVDEIDKSFMDKKADYNLKIKVSY